jgi:hypothetical protein
MTPFLTAGVCAGVAGLLTFLLIHHFWIQPIWFIFLGNSPAVGKGLGLLLAITLVSTWVLVKVSAHLLKK